ncbi:MAG: hypothetical protein IPK93_04565 [Solirubrobacterales bacterium]|nr:hypothetical protein [Solirubrobacterales bacterium]
MGTIPEGEMYDEWQSARLLPTVGLRNQEEKEQRATSSLLAVMFAVPDFARELTKDLKAPKGAVLTFTEIQLRDREKKRCIPDGAIVVKGRGSTWQCLVEVKTGSASLETDQVSRYLDWARDNEFDAVLTISNEITSSPEISPVVVDKRKLRKVNLFHLSWWRILTEAIVQHRHRGVDDPDQAWLLGELIAYLDHDKSGASGFQGMGEHWVSIRKSAANETLRKNDDGIRDVAERWIQFVDYLALGLGQDLGRDIVPVRPRSSTPSALLDTTVKEFVDNGQLQTGLKIPDAIGNLGVIADLRMRKVTTSVEIKAPREGRPLTRINWLLRQLKNASGEIRIDVKFVSTKETSSLLLSEARESAEGLLSSTDKKREPRSLIVSLARPMGTKNGKDAGSFVRETRRQGIDFYGNVVQDLREWQAPAPKLSKDEPAGEREVPVQSALVDGNPSKPD